MAFLTLRNVTKFYGENCAVSSFNLAVEQGEFISLLGPSGCGKTTTLQMIAGFENVSAGSIELNGRDITHAKPNTRGLGIVFQTYALFPHMTVEQNVAFGLEMRKVPKSERAKLVADALSLVHLDKYGQRYPRELSGGQRQRVAIARALVIKPPVLLLDEPLSNLDAKLREEMQFELRSIQRQVGTTTIMVTHDQSEAMSISDRVVVMEAGHVTQVDKPITVYEHPGNRFISTFVGKANLFHGTVISDFEGHLEVDVQGITLALTDRDTGLAKGRPALVGLRPEKIHLTDAASARLSGQVKERFFLGSQWLYHMTTPVGDITITVPNDGSSVLDVGQTAGLTWDDNSLRLISTAQYQ